MIQIIYDTHTYNSKRMTKTVLWALTFTKHFINYKPKLLLFFTLNNTYKVKLLIQLDTYIHTFYRIDVGTGN